jgi:hypothetical protein
MKMSEKHQENVKKSRLRKNNKWQKKPTHIYESKHIQRSHKRCWMSKIVIKK